MPYIIKFAHVIKQGLEPGLIFTLYSLKYEAFCIDVSCGVAGVAKVAGKVNKQKNVNKSLPLL